MPQTEVLNIISILGAISGCMFCLWWMKILKQQYVHLLTIGFAFLLVYQVMMYFYVTPILNIERLYVPVFLRDFGYAIFFVTLTIYLQELMPFQHFFMGLTIAGFIRNGLVGTICSGVYGFGLRYHVADGLSSGRQVDVLQSMLSGIKELYGITCLMGTAFLLFMLLWHIQPVRSTLKRIPYWNKVGKNMRKEL